MSEKLDIMVTNENLRENIKMLQENGYKYIVKACDKWLSGWGGATNRKHIQLIACKTSEELEKIKNDLYNDNSFNYVDWNYMNNYSSIYNWAKGKSWSLRNNWSRAFK